jgi:hypothetical protein
LDESINFLNLMGVEDVSQITFVEINELCKRYSRIQSRSREEIRDTFSKATKPTTSGVTRDELGKLLETFKLDLIGTLSLQLKTFQFKKK